MRPNKGSPSHPPSASVAVCLEASLHFYGWVTHMFSSLSSWDVAEKKIQDREPAQDTFLLLGAGLLQELWAPVSHFTPVEEVRVRGLYTEAWEGLSRDNLVDCPAHRPCWGGICPPKNRLELQPQAPQV